MIFITLFIKDFFAADRLPALCICGIEWNCRKCAIPKSYLDWKASIYIGHGIFGRKLGHARSILKYRLSQTGSRYYIYKAKFDIKSKKSKFDGAFCFYLGRSHEN